MDCEVWAANNVSGEYIMTLWMTCILVAAGLLLLIMVALDVIRRSRRPGSRASKALVAAANLNRSEQKLLRKMAHAAELPNTGCLLLSRGCFDSAAQQLLASGIDRGEIEMLRERIQSCATSESV